MRPSVVGKEGEKLYPTEKFEAPCVGICLGDRPRAMRAERVYINWIRLFATDPPHFDSIVQSTEYT